MHYKNFTTASYAPAMYLKDNSVSQLKDDIEKIECYLKLDKLYLETFRADILVPREKMNELIAMYSEKGYKLSGGITTATAGTLMGAMCYTNPETRKLLGEVAYYTAELFDEVMLDDFYFTNCRCELCIKAKGDRSWAAFRLELMNDISENIIIKNCRAARSDANIIIKFPNWYESFANCGYNLQDAPPMFDMLYTGTETRDPSYTQQNLARYLSYFLPRLTENIKPGKNGGGWYDLFECNLDDYLQQAYLTLFSKCKEQMMFCIPLLSGFPVYTAAAGAAYDTLDPFVGMLGEPVGIACYEPYHCTDNISGERHLYDFLGMLGIALEPYPTYPDKANVVFLTESSARDEDIVSKMKKTLLGGGNVFITSGLYKALAGKIEDIMPLVVSDKKVTTDTFKSNGFGQNNGTYEKALSDITISHVDYNTNDVWMMSAAMTEHYSHPMLLCGTYGSGKFYVFTTPDSPDSLYKLPAGVINCLRGELDLPVTLECGAGVGLFTYDNNTFIIQSFLTRPEKVRMRFEKTVELEMLSGTSRFNKPVKIDDNTYEVFLHPGRYAIMKYS
ncbi:MAG: hypothetical protein FWD44_07385 [Oscillospiraceae bacterium]|nr:hypothetical protein [Oscillospiraceae bacterium]